MTRRVVMLFAVGALAAGCSTDDGIGLDVGTGSSSGGSPSEELGSSGGPPETICPRDHTPPVDPLETVFVNFGGAKLEFGESNDPSQDQTENGNLVFINGGDFVAVEDDGDLGCIVDEVRKDFARFDVWITDERPSIGNYTMVVVSPSVEELIQDSPGIVAELDCRNRDGHDIVAVTSRGPLHAEAQAGLISQAIGMSLGLAAVERQGEIMDAGGHVDDDPVFLDECLPVAPDQGCATQSLDCPAGRQNSVATLLAVEPAP